MVRPSTCIRLSVSLLTLALSLSHAAPGCLECIFRSKTGEDATRTLESGVAAVEERVAHERSSNVDLQPQLNSDPFHHSRASRGADIPASPVPSPSDSPREGFSTLYHSTEHDPEPARQETQSHSFRSYSPPQEEVHSVAPPSDLFGANSVGSGGSNSFRRGSNPQTPRARKPSGVSPLTRSAYHSSDQGSPDRMPRTASLPAKMGYDFGAVEHAAITDVGFGRFDIGEDFGSFEAKQSTDVPGYEETNVMVAQGKALLKSGGKLDFNAVYRQSQQGWTPDLFTFHFTLEDANGQSVETKSQTLERRGLKLVPHLNEKLKALANTENSASGAAKLARSSSGELASPVSHGDAANPKRSGSKGGSRRRSGSGARRLQRDSPRGPGGLPGGGFAVYPSALYVPDKHTSSQAVSDGSWAADGHYGYAQNQWPQYPPGQMDEGFYGQQNHYGGNGHGYYPYH